VPPDRSPARSAGRRYGSAGRAANDRSWSGRTAARSGPPPRPRKAHATLTSNIEITLTWRLRTKWRAERLLRRVARYVLAAEGFRRGTLSIAVVGARAMSRLHQAFLGTPGPTDVLSFDLGSQRRSGRIDAEVILCADVARQRVATRGGTIRLARAELALYLVHGILHVAGYRDDTPALAARMHAREDELLISLGVGPVYSTG